MPCSDQPDTTAYVEPPIVAIETAFAPESILSLSSYIIATIVGLDGMVMSIIVTALSSFDVTIAYVKPLIVSTATLAGPLRHLSPFAADHLPV